MATENPIRIHDANGKWSSQKEAATLGASSANMSAEELGLLLKCQRLESSGREVIPSRSGSAPPTVEGSLAAIGKLIPQQDICLNTTLVGLKDGGKNYESGEQFCADPGHLAYCDSNVNLNPRLPPPLTSWGNRQQAHLLGSTNNDWRLTSFNENSRSSLNFTQSKLHTYREESEDDRSPHEVVTMQTEGSSGFWAGQNTPSSGQLGSPDGSVQEDFARISSPPLSHVSIEEAVEYDADFGSVLNASLNSPNAAISSPSGADNMGLSSNTDPSESFLSHSLSAVDMPLRSPFSSRKSNDIDVHLEEQVISGISDADLTCIKSKMMTMNVPDLQNLGTQTKESWQLGDQTNVRQQQRPQQQRSESLVAKSQGVPPGINLTHPGMTYFSHALSNYSSVEVQPILHSSEFTTPLYASTSMASPSPYYPNLHPSGYFSPQYGVGGYALNNTVFPTLTSGYPPHGAIPLSFDGAAGPSFAAQTSGVSNGGGTLHGVEMQQIGNFYGQLGFTMQPLMSNAFQMQYSHQSFRNPHNESGQMWPLMSRVVDAANRVSLPESQKGAEFTAGWHHQKTQYNGTGDLRNLHKRNKECTSPYYGNPTNNGILVQLPMSTIASPISRGSPVAGTGSAGGKNEVRFPEGSVRNAGTYSRWQGQREIENFSNTRVISFLEELKSGRGRRFELADIAGHIVQFSVDQHGSRFIQQKLENCSAEEKASVFKEVLPHASRLIIDVFGNYVIQKFFEYGSTEQRKELANQLVGQILSLSLQMYGCRVIQKALELIELNQKAKLVGELDGHVMICVHDQNGNHVIQKCIECIPSDKIGFILSAFHGQVATLSMHPYGCRVIQRVLEHCMDQPQSQFIVDEILESVCTLAQNQYGNYVTQHVLQRGKPQERTKIIRKLLGNVVRMSQHKFASNVIEKCLEHGDSVGREMLIQEITGDNYESDNLLAMMKDQYANYVIQKLLETCTDNQREMLLSRIHIHVNALKKYTYGKHIVAQYEQLYGEEMQKSDS